MLRAATRLDLDRVVSWIATARDCELWAGWRVAFPIDAGRLAEAIAFSGGNSYCLLHEEAVVAFGQIIGKADRAHLARLIVDPAVRRRGHGRRLVEGLLDEVRQRPFDRASLNVDASNVPAVSLYLSLGFHEAPRPPDEPAAMGVRYMERRSG